MRRLVYIIILLTSAIWFMSCGSHRSNMRQDTSTDLAVENHKKDSASSDKKVEIIEAEACPDHIHMLVSIPPYLSISQFMGYIKSKSALMIFDRHANLKYKYGNRHFWATGYFVDTVGKNEKIIKEYIRNQLQEDYIADQIGIEEYIDPFKKEK